MKKFLRIIATYLVCYLVMIAAIWLLCKISPFLICAVVFVPWLLAALSDGGNV